ncbi:glycine-rich extracellular protein 1 isoform X6 [Peromyscus maniculatus bairdii]|uniref:glycine-rich extracellular protein 1 isoform X6 n=1 Tax=Peromyscus maniculatus bairdii TaxID=230844 RepID=UPI003FCFCD92
MPAPPGGRGGAEGLCNRNWSFCISLLRALIWLPCPGPPCFNLSHAGFHYGNGALETGIFPETLQSGFPIANGFRNGPYGQLRPELGLEHFGDPEVKADTKSQLGNGYRGHCPSGKC